MMTHREYREKAEAFAQGRAQVLDSLLSDEAVERIAAVLHDEDCPCADQDGTGEHWRDYRDTAGLALSALHKHLTERGSAQ
jgi:Mn-dependent DtxR family transcriptional regulator